MNVPAPPRGYWANRDGKRKRRKYEKPPLTHTVAERIQADHEAFSASRPAFDPKSFDDPIPSPPVIPFSFEDAIARYRLLVIQTAIPHAPRGVHPITQRFMAEDERLAKLSRTSSWDQPKFASPEGKALLDGINRLLWFFDDLGFAPRSSGHRHIVMWVGRGPQGRNFEVAALEAPASERSRKSSLRPGRFGFWYGMQPRERAAKPLFAFAHFTRSTLRSIALLVIERWEKDFREGVQRRYDWDVAARRRALEEAKSARERERQRQIAEERALRKARADLLAEALDGSAKATQIRRMVDALAYRIGDRFSEVPEFQRWRQWALAEANALDPTTNSFESLSAWCRKFQLDD
jgi:hypothetical protein